MSFTITYRRLAIVNILHGYYLDKDGGNYFELPDDEKQSRLAEVLIKGRYNIADQLSIEATADTQKLLSAHKMVVKQTATGFLLGIAVEAVQVEDEIRHTPLIPVDANTKLQFKIKVKTNSFHAYTNTRLRPVFPACYYFTNQGNTTGKAYPSLSAAANDFKQGYLYAMGETAVVNTVASRSLKQTTTAEDNNWMPFTDAHYMGEQDRILLPKNFTYRMQMPSITEALFELKKDDETIKTINVKNEAGLNEVQLNLEKQDDKSAMENGMYTLSVSGSNNYELEHQVYLDDRLYSKDSFALVELAFTANNDEFSLLDSDGMLSRAHNEGCPRFEIRMLSRYTYWKYYFKKLQPDVEDDTWEESDTVPPGFAKVIISTAPHSLTQEYRRLQYGDRWLPNPVEAGLSLEADKICSDILIN